LCGELFGLGDSFDLPPFMRSVAIGAFGVPVRDAIMAWLSKLGVSAASPLRYFDETERLEFTHGGRDHAPMQPVSLEIGVSARETSIVGSAVVSVLYFEPCEDLMRGAA
jgi:hypothetical protein